MTNTTDTWKQNADRAMELFERKSPEQLAVELVQMQDKHAQAMVALDRMQDQRDQLAAQLKDASAQCGKLAELLRDSQRYVSYHLEHHECNARVVMGLISDIDIAIAGELPTVPEGWQLVPVMPGESMCEAGASVRCQNKQSETDWIADVYSAMLAASPRP